MKSLVSKQTKRLVGHIKTSRKGFLIACAIVYALTSVLVLGRSVTNCSSNLTGAPGDQTAGYLWLINTSKTDPWPGKSDEVNYPQGQDLWNPILATQQTSSVPYWLMSKAVGRVCAYNLLMATGFVFTAMSAVLLCFYLTRSRIASFYSGLAFAFTPYIQLKVTGHPTFAFTGFIALYLLSLIYFKNNPNLKRGFIVALFFALLAYTDGYLILLGGVLTLSFAAWWIVYELIGRNLIKSLKAAFKPLLFTFASLCVLLAPLALIQIVQKDKVSTFVSGTRGALINEATVYSLRPYELFLPSNTNPFAPEYLRYWRIHALHGSNTVESTLYLGLGNVVLAAVGILLTLSYKRTKESRRRRLVSWALKNKYILLGIIVFIFSLAFMLPPRLYIGGIVLPTPSGIVIEFITFWRVFARIFVAMILALSLLAGIGLTKLLDKVKPRPAKMLLFSIALLVLAVDYATFKGFGPPVWNYYSDPPKSVTEVSQDDTVDIVAFYPLKEQPDELSSAYLSYLPLFKKKIINGYAPASGSFPYRAGIKDLGKSYTVQALRFLGVDRIFLYTNIRKAPDLNAGLEHISTEQDRVFGGAFVHTYRVTEGLSASEVLVPAEGFHTPLPSPNSFKNISYPFSSFGEFRITSLRDGLLTSNLERKIHLTIKNITKKPRKYEIANSVRVIKTSEIQANETKEEVFSVEESVFRLQVREPDADTSFLILDMEILQ